MHEQGNTTLQKQRLELKPPTFYKVLLLNDDFTPMPFVVEILQRFFGMNAARAEQVMLEVHHKGRGVCGIFTKDVAQTHVEQVTRYAQKHQHPLACVMEEN